MSETGRSKKSRSDAFEARGSKLRGFWRAVGEVRRGEFHPGKAFGQFGVRLVGSSHFARQVARGRAAHAKWKNRFPGDSVQQERIPIFGGYVYGIHAPAFPRNSRQIWRGGNIPVPKIVWNFLKMPEAPARAGVQ